MQVLKFGGTSVANGENINKVIQLVREALMKDRTILIASALGGVTDLLIQAGLAAAAGDETYKAKLQVVEQRHLETVKSLLPLTRQSSVLSLVKTKCNEIEDICNGIFLLNELSERTRDKIASYGELLSSLIISAKFEALDIPNTWKDSRELISTNSNFGYAAVDFSITNQKIRTFFDASKGDLFILPGFIASDTNGVTTTLGRGGSDTTAVALAAALEASVCEIYTDVAGVFTADPRLVPEARKLPYVSFEEMLEMSASGAGVLQLRSVEYARNHGVRIHCRSSIEDGPGTLVISEEETMEQPFVTAVTHSNAEARVTLRGVRDEPGVAGRIFSALAGANVNVDVIIQNEPVGDDQLADLSFTVDRADLATAREAIEALDGVSLEMRTDEAIGKVSIVGAGMRSHPGVAAKVFQVLGDERINIEMISTSPIKISCVIPADRVPDAVKSLHKAFELGTDAVRPEDPAGAEHRPTVAG